MKLLDRLFRQQRQPPPDALALGRTRMAMQVGGAMAIANRDLSRPDIGVEMAELCAAAARAAVFAYTGASSPEEIMFPIDWPNHAQLAYSMEWRRLLATDREKWR